MTIQPRFSSEAVQLRLTDQDSECHQLSDYLGTRMLLSFLPKVSTPAFRAHLTCLQEAHDLCEKRGAVFLGIVDEPASKLRLLMDQENLQLTLLPDRNHNLARSIGIWTQKSLLGKELWGALKSSFLIDEQGQLMDQCLDEELGKQVEWWREKLRA